MRKRSQLAIASAAVIAVGVFMLALHQARAGVDSSTIADASVFLPGGAWCMIVQPDGSARLQYGSSAGDDASVPPGTIDFRQFVNEAARQQSRDAPRGGTSAALRRRGETSTRAYLLRDDRFFRALVRSAAWQSAGTRFGELWRARPPYGDERSVAVP